MKITPFALIGASCLVLSTAHAAFPYTETFSVDNDAAGWQPFFAADTGFAAQNPGTDRLDFGATQYGVLFLSADANASGGAFTGSYLGLTNPSVSFDLTLDLGATVSGLSLQLTDFTNDETWEYLLTPNAAGTTQSFLVPIDLAGTGWSQITGDQPFSAVLGNVEDFSVVLNGSNDVSGSVDNLAVVPEPGSALFAGLPFIGLLRRRRVARA